MKPSIVAGRHPVAPSISTIGANHNLEFLDALGEWYLNHYNKYKRSFSIIHKTLKRLMISDSELIKRHPKRQESFYENISTWNQIYFELEILADVYETIYKFQKWTPDAEPSLINEQAKKRFKEELPSSIRSTKQLSRLFNACPKQADHLASTLFTRLKKKNIAVNHVEFVQGTLLSEQLTTILTELNTILLEVKAKGNPETNIHVRHDYFPIGDGGIKLPHNYLALTTEKSNLTTRLLPSKLTILTILLSFYISSYREDDGSRRAVNIQLGKLKSSFRDNYWKEAATIAFCGLEQRPPTKSEVTQTADRARKYIQRNPNDYINKGSPSLLSIGFSD